MPGANQWIPADGHRKVQSFVRVPEPRTAKNRMHFDLRAPHTMDGEVERLQAAGATVAERFDSLTVMQDPEGNVFCVELGPDD